MSTAISRNLMAEMKLLAMLNAFDKTVADATRDQVSYTECTDWPDNTSVRVTVPRSAGLTPGPAIGAPLVRSAGQRMLSQGGPRTFWLLLHANGSAPEVSVRSSSDVSTYREQPA